MQNRTDMWACQMFEAKTKIIKYAKQFYKNIKSDYLTKQQKTFLESL